MSPRHRPPRASAPRTPAQSTTVTEHTASRPPNRPADAPSCFLGRPVSPDRPRTYPYPAIAALIRHRLTLSLATAAAAVALALPAGAMAGTCAPPGNSGVNQYVEVVPGVGCNHPSTGPGSGNSGTGGGHLSSGTSHQLAAAGSTGHAVQALVASSGTGTGSGSGSGSG